MRVGFVEWPDGLLPEGSDWEAIGTEIAEASIDLLVTNELPFGDWIAAAASFDRDTAAASIAVHEAGIAALARFQVGAVLTSRPVWFGEKLANEAVHIADGVARAVHRKRYFPSEPGWYEGQWYAPGNGFRLAGINDAKVGVLLCTDVMFNEHARAYGRDGADLIVVPRATGREVEPWLTAGAMSALVSGAYVVSSNRVGRQGAGPDFGGVGFAYAPGGALLATTSPSNRLGIIEVDLALGKRAKQAYPVYVDAPI